MKRQVVIRTLYVVIAVLAITGVVAVALRAAELSRAFFGDSIPATGSFDGGFVQWPSLTLLHIIPGLILMVLGPLQFVAKIRSRYVSLHRWCGRIYVASGLLVGITALVMGIVIGFGGPTETTAVTVFSALFLFFLGRAIFHIRRREVPAHREWMIRAFALGLAVATMRPMMATFIAFTDLPFADILGISFWLAFSLHLVIAELWVRFTRRERTPVPVALIFQSGAPVDANARR
jgi:uncharacterized membrane protein